MEAHITSVCEANNFRIMTIGYFHQYLLEEAAAQVIHAFVSSSPGYYDAVLGGQSEKSLLCPRRVLNHATLTTFAVSVASLS